MYGYHRPLQIAMTNESQYNNATTYNKQYVKINILYYTSY